MRRFADATDAVMTGLHIMVEQLANPLKRLLAIPLSNQKTVAKWLVIPQSAGFAMTSDLVRVICAPSRMASWFSRNVRARGRPMGSPLRCSDPFALSEVLL
jgi:hypothetical protein